MTKDAKPFSNASDEITYTQAPPPPRPAQIRDNGDPNRLYGLPQGTVPPPLSDEEMDAGVEIIEFPDPDTRKPPEEVE